MVEIETLEIKFHFEQNSGQSTSLSEYFWWSKRVITAFVLPKSEKGFPALSPEHDNRHFTRTLFQIRVIFVLKTIPSNTTPYSVQSIDLLALSSKQQRVKLNWSINERLANGSNTSATGIVAIINIKGCDPSGPARIKARSYYHTKAFLALHVSIQANTTLFLCVGISMKWRHEGHLWKLE